MKDPDYVIQPELMSSIEQVGATPLVKSIAELFGSYSDRVRQFIDNIIERPVKLGELKKEQIDFVHEYGERFINEESESYSSHMDINRSEHLRKLLQKYPSMVQSFLPRGERDLFQELDPTMQKSLIMAAYQKASEDYNDRHSTNFNGSKHYRVNQNIHGDVFLDGIPFIKEDTQIELFNTPNIDIRELDTEHGEAMFMYQETTSLLTMLCRTYARANMPHKDLELLMERLHKKASHFPNCADIQFDDMNVRLANRHIFGDSLSFDSTREYEHTGFHIYPGHHRVKPLVAIRGDKHLVLLIPNNEGEILFGTSHKYKKIFEIPSEDILGIIELLHSFPGRSGLTNKGILEEFVKDYKER